jgi:hypothetical protein
MVIKATIGSFQAVKSQVMSSSVVELAKITSSEDKESRATPASTEVPTKTTSVQDGTSAPNSTP